MANQYPAGVENYEEKQHLGDKGLLKGVESQIDEPNPNIMPGNLLFQAEKKHREQLHQQKERELQFERENKQKQSQS